MKNLRFKKLLKMHNFIKTYEFIDGESLWQQLNSDGSVNHKSIYYNLEKETYFHNKKVYGESIASEVLIHKLNGRNVFAGFLVNGDLKKKKSYKLVK